MHSTKSRTAPLCLVSEPKCNFAFVSIPGAYPNAPIAYACRPLRGNVQYGGPRSIDSNFNAVPSPTLGTVGFDLGKLQSYGLTWRRRETLENSLSHSLGASDGLNLAEGELGVVDTFLTEKTQIFNRDQ